jgi:DNA ligase-1
VQSLSDLATLVSVSESVAGTSSRTGKIDLLADYLRRLDLQAVPAAVAFLSGVIPQGSLGVGWATIGDLPEPSPEPRLELAEVMAAFDELVATSGPGSAARSRGLVDELMASATAPEQQFLFRLMTGEVRQGALEGVMVEAVARAATTSADRVRRALMLNGRIWEVAQLALGGGADALNSVGLMLFRPLKPMLAQSAEDVGAALERTGPALVDWKLDGVRVQAHRQGAEVELYTRNLNRVTDRLDEVVAAVADLDCASAVLDGEVLFMDAGGRPARFQETAGRFGTDEMPHKGLAIYFFDVVHLDGTDLLDRPLDRRRDLLSELAGQRVVPGRVVETADEAGRVMEESLAAGHEGVVVKAIDSTYQAGRRGAAWVKVKPVHTLDLVVLGAEWGHGRRSGWLSNLHLGARHGDEFVMLGKTFKGLTDQMLAWQTEQFLAREIARDRYTVYVRPELVVEIAFNDLQASPHYPGGLALRFARVKAYRPDKRPEEADTIDTVRAIHARQGGQE